MLFLCKYEFNAFSLMPARKILNKMHAVSNVRNIKVNLTSSLFSTDTFD